MIILRLLTQTVAFAFTQIWANKVRAMLTCLGIIIGVWAITTVFSARPVSSISILEIRGMDPPPAFDGEARMQARPRGRKPVRFARR